MSEQSQSCNTHSRQLLYDLHLNMLKYLLYIFSVAMWNDIFQFLVRNIYQKHTPNFRLFLLAEIRPSQAIYPQSPHSP